MLLTATYLNLKYKLLQNNNQTNTITIQPLITK